jgi:hypothetical protein
MARRPDDRTRLLMRLVRDLFYTHLLSWDKEGVGDRVHFEPLGRHNLPRAGDLVLGRSRPLNDWTVAVVHEVLAHDRLVLRAFGSQDLLTVAGEDFVRIIGLRREDLYEGERYVFYERLLQALKAVWAPQHRYHCHRFEGHEVVVTVMPRYGRPDAVPVPFEVRMPWETGGTALPLAEIKKRLVDGGLGTRPPEYAEAARNP